MTPNTGADLGQKMAVIDSLIMRQLLMRERRGKPQFINYSRVWKDNLWSITEVSLMSKSEGQTQEYG